MQTRRQFLASAAAASVVGWRHVQAQAPQSVATPGVDVGELTRSFALRNVTVIDCTGKPARPGMTVVIAGNRISSISPATSTTLRGSTEVAESAGKFLIPGLWDMHTHIDPKGFPLFIPNGITGIREMTGDNTEAAVFRLRAEIAAGQRLGPRVIACARAYGIDGFYGRGPARLVLPAQIVDTALGAGFVNTVEEARNRVRRAVQDRADFVKVHDPMVRDLFLAVLAEARDQKIPVAGHVPLQSATSPYGNPEVTLVEASNAGLASLEHIDHIRAYLRRVLGGPDDVVMKDLNPSHTAALGDLFDVFRRNGTWVCPTFTDTARTGATKPDDPRLKYFDAAQQKLWQTTTGRASGNIPPEIAERAARVLQAHLSFVGAMHKTSVGLLAGTDARPQFGMPGFRLHDELIQFVAAGLTPMDALRTATSNPAQFLGLTDLGTVETGKLAEMVLLDANPLDDITNTTRINMVFTGGRVYRRQALDKILAAVAANASN